ncbi:metallophosphoesterase [Actinoplanes utahensis]|uniref:metallophosphoesterase n=1 Tax=Actinoplanes utahensis TaxID=1869 RepID=UPI0036121948
MVLVTIGLIHFYLWKRLVRDPLRPGVGRRVGTVLAVLLCVLAPVTLIGVRAGHFKWLAWPGYLWIAVMFYLLVTLAVLEIPRFLMLRSWASGGRTPGKGVSRTGATTAAATPVSPRGATDPITGTATPADAVATSVTAAPDSGADGNEDAGVGVGDADAGVGDAAAEKQGIERRLLLARGTAIFAGLTAAGITGYGVRTATGAPRIDRFAMPMAKLPRAMDGTRIAVVSDIHIGPLTGVSHAERIVQVINSVNADLVCVVGDLVDGSVAELGRFAAPLGGIQSRHGAFFVTGNHEYYSGAEEWIREVDRLGLRPLRNERVAIDGLDLAGVNDLTGEEQGDAPDFARALGDRDTSRPVVLMAHQPVAAKEAAPYGVDLQVSGHTHGGQMAPFNMLVKLQQPVVSGFGEVDGVPVYVTNGAGYWGPPVRVGAPPQVTVIELRVA